MGERRADEFGMSGYLNRADMEADTVDVDGWIEWAGGECPVSPDTYVQYQMREEKREYAARISGLRGTRASDLLWADTNKHSDIIAYRVVSA